MGKVKGCINQDCKANKKKSFFDAKNNFCPLCGQELAFVCKNKKCYTQLAVTTKKPYCVRCLAERKQNINAVAKAGMAVLSVGAILIAKKNPFNDKK